MPNNDYVKTQKGMEELSERKYKLPQKLRTMLILINGATSAETLIEQGTKLGVPPSFIEELEAQGFIEKVGGSR